VLEIAAKSGRSGELAFADYSSQGLSFLIDLNLPDRPFRPR
jgi:hypothetical protein